MVVQVIVADIGKNGSTKGDTSYTMLHQSMGTHFHETVGTPCLHHLVKQLVKLDAIRSSELSWQDLVIDFILHSR